LPKREPENSCGVEELLKDCKVAPKDLEVCLKHLKEFMEPFMKHLPREQLRGHGETFIRGLLSDLERKSIEPIAEREGQKRRNLQHFIGNSPWNHEPLLNQLCQQVARDIGSPQGILVLDPSAFPKKGTDSVGVARQWCGRLGKVDNCQLGVFLGYVSNNGHTLVDERLYLPRRWTKDKTRRALCHVPESIKFKTVHQLSLQMLKKRGSQLPHAWVTGDDEFGRPAWFRQRLRKNRERYMLEIPSNTRVCAAQNPPKTGGMGQPRKAPFFQATVWKDSVPKDQWVRLSIRDGLKGPLIVWATRARVRARLGKKRRGREEWLVVTRTDSKVPENRYYLSNAGLEISLEEMAHVANARHWIEDCFERGKGEVGLDHYEVRAWKGWHHHMTLCMLALWFLVLEQRRLNENTPAITLQQSAHAIEEIIRDPDISLRQLALQITQRLERTELARIDHWKKFNRLPSPWTQMRLMHVSQ
jgi:SRSO17 transposase